ncbi:hypothetical protein N7478_011964 [Penicillium angulare]|uniref:uncharacterized protein n=1 Tax=Penicillium angulare TaxID=116970 RepID=UPI002541C80B|nr:uncharacterized protein N7478_011964 [Penicillium angulare]KAJ5261369.1 hypothetical protein N7478_011964 [Penicillium angulare]
MSPFGLLAYVEESPSSIKQELVSLTNAYTRKPSHKSATGAKSTVGVVLASIRSDDLTWLRDYCHETYANSTSLHLHSHLHFGRDPHPDLQILTKNFNSGSTPFVYSGDQKPEPNLLIPANLRGREAPAYLSYVVDFYDNLPDYSIFVHAHPEQWHNDLFGPFTGDTIKNIRFQSVDALGYVNLRCEHNPGCPTGVNPLNPTKIDIEGKDIRAYFADAYQEIFNVPRSEVPKEIGNVCCGQFVVSRERILARPIEDYQRILNWAGTTKQTDSFGVGWVMEKLWHIVFGMDAIYCPRYEQCRCDVYGWCGPLPSGEMLTPATKNEL